MQDDQRLSSVSQERPQGFWRKIYCCLLAFFPVIGAVLGVLVFLFLTSGWLTGWKQIENPPEKAAQIVQIDGPMVWIATSTGAKYLNAASDACGNGCWVQVADIEPGHPMRGDLGWSPQTCESPPPIFGAVQTRGECKINNWTDDNSVYALRSDGSILAWHYSIAKEWIVVELIVFALLGAFVVFLVGLVVYFIRRSRKSLLT
jgi:hypothetical protein